MTKAVTPEVRAVSHRVSGEYIVTTVALAGLVLYLLITIAIPLVVLFQKSFLNVSGGFVGFANYMAYFETPALFSSIRNSFLISALTTLITVPLAYVFAFALTRTCMPGKVFFRGIALIPILAPSMLPALALIYIFGNQGVLKSWLFGSSIYGLIGIVMAEVFYCFPHALIILIASMSLADARLYDSAKSLGARPVRTFLTVTLPMTRYGVVNASFVVAAMAITDFGVPKVLGGQFNVLATDVYMQVVGQQNLEMGAVVGVILLIPLIFAFTAEAIARRGQKALLTGGAVPFQPSKRPIGDWVMLAFCSLIGCAILTVVGFAAWGSLIGYWPYDLRLTLNNYNFEQFGSDGWAAYRNSLYMSFAVAFLGTAITFTGAYLLEKPQGNRLLKRVVHSISMIPVAVPGLVLGVGYLLFFNSPYNPLVFLYGTLTILIINTIAHFYTVCHLTALTALKQLDNEFEAVSYSLKVPLRFTFIRVSVPVCLPAILDIMMYFFLNSMTTVSAVIFLYSIDTRVASVTIINMMDFGFIAPAAALSMVIVYTSAAVRLAHALLTFWLLRRTQVWRKRSYAEIAIA